MTPLPACYVGWSRLVHDFLLSQGGKLATLWFDTIIFHLPQPELIDLMVTRLGVDAVTERVLKQVWVPVHRYTADYSFLAHPWEVDQPDVLDAALRIATEDAQSRHPTVPDEHPAWQQEVAAAGAELLDSVSLWLALNQEFPCSFLPDEREHRLLDDLFGRTTMAPDSSPFFNLMLARVPDLSEYPWEQLFELRQQQPFSAFRRKLATLQEQLHRGEQGPAAEMAEEILRRDMVAMTGMLGPGPQAAPVQGRASKTPLPVPIPLPPPFLPRVEGHHKEQTSDSYGWLYFLIDAGEKGPDSTG